MARYNQPEQGTTDWHEPLNQNFADLEVDVIYKRPRTPDATQEDPADNAMFIDVRPDYGDIYLGDGTSWGDPVWSLSDIGSGGSGSGASTDVVGIDHTPTHVGPLREGLAGHTTTGAGVMFWAQGGLSINSAVVDTDLSTVSTTTMSIELAHYDGGAANPGTVGTLDVTVSGGPERIDLSGLPDIPADGQYVLARTASPNGETMPARRIGNEDFGAARYNEQTYPMIDFRRGTNITEAGDWGSEDYWYYFFDIEVGDAADRVTSPWSTDVDEIYMRPRDPAEEFDVSPRALWIDTS